MYNLTGIVPHGKFHKDLSNLLQHLNLNMQIFPSHIYIYIYSKYYEAKNFNLLLSI